MKHFSQITFSLLLACHASLCLAASPRVALMPSGDKKASAIVDLMEVALAQRDDLVLLDRANVGRMLAEQKLVLEGLLSADDAFAIGKLLGCDVFGELFFQAKDDGASAVGVLTAFDAITGVRLCDATLDVSGSLQAISAAAGEILLEALQKWAGGTSTTTVRAVTLLSLRNVDLPLAQSHLPEVLGTTLERQLLRSAGITVLERKCLNQINQEAALTGDLRDRLLTSSVLLDLDLSRGTTTVSLRIRGVVGNNAGKEIAVVALEHDGSDVEGLVAALAQRLLEALELPRVVVSGDMKNKESDRFAAEARRLMRRNRFEEALVALEAAVALDPANTGKQALLCEAMQEVGIGVLENKRHVEAIDILERSVAFQVSWLDAGFVPKESWAIDFKFKRMLRGALSNTDKIVPHDRERLITVRQLYRRRLCDKTRDADLWADNGDEWLEALMSSPSIPHELTFASTYESRTGQKKESRAKDQLYYGFDIRDLSPTGLRRLMDYYAGWRKKVDGACWYVQSYLCQLMLLRFFPDAFDNADDLLRGTLNELVDRVINDKTGSGPIYYLTLNLPELNLPPSLLVPVYRRLEAETDRRKIVSTVIASTLDSIDKEGAAYAGAYLQESVRRLSTPEYGICARSYEFGSSGGVPGSRDEALVFLRDTFRQRYGKDADVGGYVASGPAAPFPGWRSVTKLFECDKRGSTRKPPCIMSAALDGDTVYLVVYAKRPDYPARDRKLGYELQRVDLNSGLVKQLARVDHEGGFDGPIHIGSNAAYIPGSAGVMIVPLDESAVWFMKRGIDIPDADVNAIIEVGDSLYIACSEKLIEGDKHSYRIRSREGLLLRCNLDGSNMSVLASSARREKLTCLDNCDPYRINGFFKDMPRNRILFGIGDNRRSMGLFAFDLESQQISRVWNRSIGGLRAWHDDDYGLVAVGATDELTLWNCATDKPETFVGNIKRGKEPAGYRDVESVTLLGDRLYGVIYHYIVNRGSSVYFMTAKKGEALKAGCLVPEFEHRGSWAFFVRNWKGKLIVCDWYQLTMLEPDSNPVSID